MKLNESVRSVETNIQAAPEAFQIAATSHAFKILSANLYNDRILAIIRELICNAVDAHISAGKPDEPVEVHLPTMLDPELRIKDNGIGMSHETVMTLYRTYFGSDKNQTNELIGGLGLGSKSPFSYTDQFTVGSRYNSQMRVYQAFISQAGTPSIMQVGDTQITNEPNGIEIIIPVRTEDMYEFKSKYINFVRFMDNPPVCAEAGVVPLAEPLYTMDLPSGASFRMHNKLEGVGYGTALVRMGIVTYQVYDASLFAAEVCRAGILELPIGTIDISPNRESLSPSQTQKKLLRDLYKEVQDEANRRAAEIIEAQPTLIEAMETWKSFSSITKMRSCKWKHPTNGDVYQINGWHTLPDEVKVPRGLDIRTITKAWRSSKPKSTAFRREGVSKLPEAVFWSEKQMPFMHEIEKASLLTASGSEYIWVIFGPAAERDAWLEIFNIEEYDTIRRKPKAPKAPKAADDDDEDADEDTGFQYAMIEDRHSYYHDNASWRLNKTDILAKLKGKGNIVLTDALVMDNEFLTLVDRYKNTAYVVFVPNSHKKVRSELIAAGAVDTRAAYVQSVYDNELVEQYLSDAGVHREWANSDWGKRNLWTTFVEETTKKADDPRVAEFHELHAAAAKDAFNPSRLLTLFDRYGVNVDKVTSTKAEADAAVRWKRFQQLCSQMKQTYPNLWKEGDRYLERPKLNIYYMNHAYKEATK